LKLLFNIPKNLSFFEKINFYVKKLEKEYKILLNDYWKLNKKYEKLKEDYKKLLKENKKLKQEKISDESLILLLKDLYNELNKKEKKYNININEFKTKNCDIKISKIEEKNIQKDVNKKLIKNIINKLEQKLDIYA